MLSDTNRVKVSPGNGSKTSCNSSIDRPPAPILVAHREVSNASQQKPHRGGSGFRPERSSAGFPAAAHSVHSSAYGFIPIPIVVLKNGDGPTALFVSGTHGDEYEGQVALCNLVRSLDPASVHGRVIILPAAN